MPFVDGTPATVPPHVGLVSAVVVHDELGFCAVRSADQSVVCWDHRELDDDIPLPQPPEDLGPVMALSGSAGDFW